jgi:hypothetical protein
VIASPREDEISVFTVTKTIWPVRPCLGVTLWITDSRRTSSPILIGA